MRIRPGLKVNSAVSAAQVVVVRAPAGEVDLRCGGVAMVPADAPVAADGTVAEEGSLLVGKRYADAGGTIELLCVRAGAGTLSLGGEPLELMAARQLPTSD